MNIMIEVTIMIIMSYRQAREQVQEVRLHCAAPHRNALHYNALDYST